MSQEVYRVDYLPTASRQLIEIEDYIVDHDAPVEAYDFTARIKQFCDALGLFPRKHLERDDIRKDLHLVGFEGSVMIGYHVDDVAHVVTVIGIFYGGQNWEPALRSIAAGF